MAKVISNPIAEGVARVDVATPARAAARVGPLLLAVFVCGASAMALEMTASRLLAPYFGTSIFTWANLIGLVMIYLTAGYTLGGRLADRNPAPGVLYAIIAAAGLTTAAIPAIAGPALRFAESFPNRNIGTDFGSITAIILLFLLPVTLLGCVSPFAVRLRLREVGGAGKTAGSLYALSTLGSILGTFVPVFLLLPYLGITATLLLAGGAMALVAAIGALIGRRGADPGLAASPEASAPVARQAQPGATVGSMPALLLAVFICGVGVMALEMTASQLLRPYFGSSLFIWANLIGLVMIYLTAGYWLGGRLADRFPRVGALYALIAVAGAATALAPLLAQPILTWSLEGFREVSVSILYGSLAGVIALFAIPMILLGCVSPFAIRLRMRDSRAAGQTAGAIYAMSTLGSILGTFIPVFLLLPALGSGRTLYLVAAMLLLVATIGLLTGAGRGARVAAVALLAVAALSLIPPPSLIKPPPYADSTLLAERETPYNYIQVVGRGNGDVDLVLNEGHAIHSIYRADQSHPLTGGPWDYWLVAPYVNPNMRPENVQDMLMLGSAAGTAAKLFTTAYGPKPVDNVELDPEIVALGRQYFHLDEPNVNNIVRDARSYLHISDHKYSIVGIDAYRQPYIPFHLTTKEFFEEVRDHLRPDGVVMINAGRTATDFRLVDVIAATMRAVYPHVYIIDVASGGNSMVLGSMAADGIANFEANAAGVTQPLLRQVFDETLQHGNLREVRPAAETGQQVFTDDRAPVEEVVDQVILSYAAGQ